MLWILVAVLCFGHLDVGSTNSQSQFCASFTEYGWLTQDPSKSICFTYFNKMSTWFDAKDTCEKLGMSLARPNTESIDEYLIRKVQPTTTKTFWIGAVNEKSRGWKWSTGEKVEYSGFDPLDEVRDKIKGFFRRTTSCAMVDYMFWEKTDCDTLSHFVCQSEGNTSLVLKGIKNIPSHGTFSGESTQICSSLDDHESLSPDPFRMVCFVFVEKRISWWDANKKCNSQGMTLATVNGSNTNQFLKSQIRRNIVTDFWMANINNDDSGWKWNNDPGMVLKVINWAISNLDRISQKSLCPLFGENGGETKNCNHLAPFVCQTETSTTEPEISKQNRQDTFKDRNANQTRRFTLTKTSTIEPQIPKRKRQDTFKAQKVIRGRLNPKLTHRGIATERTSSVSHCVRLCSATNNCTLINFCEKIRECVLYDNFTTALNGAVNSEKGCSVYVDMDAYYEWTWR